MSVPLIAAGNEIGPPTVVHQLVQECVIRPLFYNHYVTGAEPDTAELRTSSTVRFMPQNSTLASLTAAWIYTGGRPPAEICVLLKPDSSPPARKWMIRAIRTPVSVNETAKIAGVAITTPERTIVDLARWEPQVLALRAIQKLINYGADPVHAQRLVPQGQRNCHRASAIIQEATAGYRP